VNIRHVGGNGIKDVEERLHAFDRGVSRRGLLKSAALTASALAAAIQPMRIVRS
jgi:hypothetical protein